MSSPSHQFGQTDFRFLLAEAIFCELINKFPEETREAIKLISFLDGQTVNPSLVAKNPETAGKKFTKPEIFDFYKKVVTEVSGLIPDGSVSIEVYADMDTTADQMLEQGRDF